MPPHFSVYRMNRRGSDGGREAPAPIGEASGAGHAGRGAAPLLLTVGTSG